MDAAIGEEIEGSRGIEVVIEGIERPRWNVSRRDPVGFEKSFDPYHQKVFFFQAAGYFKNEGKMPAFVGSQLHAVEPDLGQVIHRAKAQENSFVHRRRVAAETSLVPGRAQIIPKAGELFVPTGGNREGFMF